jgi:putative nucleotidyltransferase with HDIG domain
VGGAVRDVLRAVAEAPGEDTDVACDLEPDRVRALFPRTEPIGEAHGTVLVLWEGARLEFTTLRREGAYADARHPDQVWFTRDPLEDLARRDLTVNALAFDPLAGELLDPFAGALDLERGVLRAVGDPVVRFREDALRPLRAARLAATLGLTLEPATRAALGAALDLAPRLALERVRAELEKLLAAPRPSEGIELLREAGLLALWLPELDACRGVPQNRHHAYEVYEHLLRSCDAAPADRPAVRWAALLHDLGKPGTRVERHGEGTFHGHERLGAALADTLLERLRFPNDRRARIVHLVREHMFDYRTEWSDGAVRRWLRRVGPEAVDDLFALRRADAAGRGGDEPPGETLGAFGARIERVLAAGSALTVRDLAVDGADVMRVLAVPPGPEVGAALEHLLESVLDDPAGNARESLLARLESLRRQGPGARADA